jgi:hypothetical protein
VSGFDHAFRIGVGFIIFAGVLGALFISQKKRPKKPQEVHVPAFE